MGKNVEFGRRVRRTRESLQMKKKRLAELVGIELFRLRNLESEQADESEFTDEELKKLARELNSSLCELLHEEDDSHRPHCGSEQAKSSAARLPVGVIARRSSGRSLSQQFDIASGCPHCGSPASGSRCDRCGRPLD